MSKLAVYSLILFRCNEDAYISQFHDDEDNYSNGYLSTTTEKRFNARPREGKPYCNQCYGALFGPKGYGHGGTESHTFHGGATG
ncbi:hypothetical protein NECAME_03600 [Necator americanus]|uniref:Uncharacterized protein n=1 Tax=Necator americanus TaxID=51031 RepID=W2T397_NECAM|nr:hypothetical protein NECAME_03600 [Necator americanus]ETN76034.1 hypothetical protein NECAME_03600 [Necator americanus]